MTYVCGFAKVGKSIKFKVDSHGATGGDNEAPQLIRLLANNNPDIQFEIIGRSDFDRLSATDIAEMFPYGNVSSKIAKRKFRMLENCNDALFEMLGDTKIDSCIMMAGTVGTVNIPDRIYKVGAPTEIAKVLGMFYSYSSYIMHWLNETKTPYIEIINDPRYYLTEARDLFHSPKDVLSQYSYNIKTNPILSYTNQTRKERITPVRYAGVETIFCYGYGKPNTKEPSHKFSIVLNEGEPSRYPLLKEWVLDHIAEVDVYGKWSDERTLEDKRFVGPKPMAEVQAIMADTRYTFIIPIKKGWVTSKYIEMIHAGCIPFFHPYYDGQDHLKYPAILKPKTPDDLMKAIEYFESHPEDRMDMIRKLQETYCSTDRYDGTYVNNQVMSSLIPGYKKPDVSKFKKNKAAVFDL